MKLFLFLITFALTFPAYAESFSIAERKELEDSAKSIKEHMATTCSQAGKRQSRNEWMRLEKALAKIDRNKAHDAAYKEARGITDFAKDFPAYACEVQQDFLKAAEDVLANRSISNREKISGACSSTKAFQERYRENVVEQHVSRKDPYYGFDIAPFVKARQNYMVELSNALYTTCMSPFVTRFARQDQHSDDSGSGGHGSKIAE